MGMGLLSMGDSRHCEEHVLDTSLESGWASQRRQILGEAQTTAQLRGGSYGSSCVVLVNVAALLCVGDERTQMPRTVTQRDRVAWNWA